MLCLFLLLLIFPLLDQYHLCQSHSSTFLACHNLHRVGAFFTIILQEDSKLSNLLNQPIAYVISVNRIVLQRQLNSSLHAMPVLSAQSLHSILHYRGSFIAGYMLCLFFVPSQSYTIEFHSMPDLRA